jgi:Rrf2 family protein
MRVDYAMRALSMLAASAGRTATCPEIAEAQGIPVTYLRLIMRDLLRSRLVRSVRGRSGGYVLCRPPTEVTLAAIARSVGVAISSGTPSRNALAAEDDVAHRLGGLRAVLNEIVDQVLSQVTLAQLLHGELPRLTSRSELG